MRDYHNEQFAEPRSGCSGKNCAAASAGIAIFFATRGATEMDAADVREASGISCIPGVDSPSGGLTISAVERVCEDEGVEIDYRGRSSSLRHWTTTEGKTRLSWKYGCVMLGHYSEVKWPWRAKGSTFQGTHSVFVHDYREDLPDSHYKKIGPTVCWHDPLRARPIRVPWSVAVAYWQKAGSEIKGFAGFVVIPPIPGGTYARAPRDRTRTAYRTVAVHRTRTKGAASTVRIIRPRGTLVEIHMWAKGESYRGSTRWGAMSLLADDWIAEKRLKHVGGST